MATAQHVVSGGSMKGEMAVAGIGCAVVLVKLAVICAIVGVIVHFVAKYW